MRRSLLLILSLMLVVFGLLALSACPKTETEQGTGIEQPGGKQIPPGTPATTTPEEAAQPAEGTEAGPAEEGAGPSGEEAAGAGDEGTETGGAEPGGEAGTEEGGAEEGGDAAEAGGDAGA
ncbi:MAG: hypothetical protein B1H03_02340 [Planctomycetales bacterium 4484_113]|nr:MAG: hypothetical protein B1H03_02340 [Planctomycetales bacterium 4484_113]